MDETRRRQIDSLLRELSEWRRMSGFDPVTDAGSEIRSTGESNAAIEELRAKLDALGVRYAWDASAREYRIHDGEDC